MSESDIKVAAPEKPIGDEEQLAALGQVQELRGEVSPRAIVCLQTFLMATREALSPVVSTALTSGGATACSIISEYRHTSALFRRILTSDVI